MTGGFKVDLDVLDDAANAVSQTMRDMESCQVSDICGPPEEYGHDELRAAFDHFCARWQQGVEILLEDGESISEALRRAAQSYREIDRDTEDTLRGLGTDPAAGTVDG